ncbi:MAG: hypothetical protein IJL52_04200 [Clostridia bacterium]|nr:hypothetical protein [Clostridia bacterium]
MKRVLILFVVLLLLTGCKKSGTQPAAGGPTVPEAGISETNEAITPSAQKASAADQAAKSTDDLPMEYYFPAMRDAEYMEDVLLSSAYIHMTWHPQFQGAFVSDFEKEVLAPDTEDEWGLYRVTLHTDRGDYTVVFNGHSQFISDSITPNASDQGFTQVQSTELSAEKGASQAAGSEEPTSDPVQTPPAGPRTSSTRPTAEHSEPRTSAPAEPTTAASADDKPMEYYFPALMERENMGSALLYRACYFMTQYPQFQGAFVSDFEVEDSGQSEDGWAQFRVTLHTDRGDYSVVETENGRFVSDSAQ